MGRFSFFITRAYIISSLLLITSLSLSAQEAIAPPSIGQQTQGEQTNLSEPTSNSIDADEEAIQNEDTTNSNFTDLLGTTEIIELRGENGQVYAIELEHSNGSKQYIERDYSNGQIDSKPNNLEETPNLAKWRLGSW